MSKLISTSAVVLALFLSGHISAQEQAPQTTASFLAQHHVEDSPPGLRAALANPDPAVRGVAAGLLAQKMDTKSIPFLETALVREPRIDIQVTLAGALNELGDGVGHRWLVNKCNQANAAPVARMLAANKLLETHSDDCLGPVLDMLGGEPGHDGTSLGLQYLRKSKTPPDNSLRELKIKLEATLSDSTPEDRWNASRILAVIGDSASVTPMQKAIQEETNVEYRHRLEDNLRALRAHLRPPA